MAALSKHGKEIGRIEHLTYTKAYFENGDILINCGFGWKVHGKIKEGYSPRDVYARKVEKMAQWRLDYPMAARFMSELHDIAGIKDRWRLMAAIEIMPDDPDGVWSEVCDGYGDNLHTDIQEIVELCRLYKLIESKNQE